MCQQSAFCSLWCHLAYQRLNFKVQVFIINEKHTRKSWWCRLSPATVYNLYHQSSLQSDGRSCESGHSPEHLLRSMGAACMTCSDMKTKWSPTPTPSTTGPAGLHLPASPPISHSVPTCSLLQLHGSDSPFPLLIQGFCTCYSFSLKYFSLHFLSS